MKLRLEKRQEQYECLSRELLTLALSGMLLLGLALAPVAVFADVDTLPHAYSEKIAIIPDRCEGTAGCLPPCGSLPGYEDKTCEEEILDRSKVKAINNIEELKKYDTIVFFQFCDIGHDDYAGFRKVLLEWVKLGGKLIIIDSDSCNWPDHTQADYSWLSEVGADFETDTPGQTGQHVGRLQVVEENNLSSADKTSPYFVDTDAIAKQTDAVGDMNVIIAYGRAWCADMEGENIHKVSGFGHAYTRPGFRALGDGWIIYNALDTDYITVPPPLGSSGTGGQEIGKIYQFELLHGWGGRKEMEDLKCKVPLGKFCTSPAYDRFIELERVEFISEASFYRLIDGLYNDLEEIKESKVTPAIYLAALGEDWDKIIKLLERALNELQDILKGRGPCNFEDVEIGRLQTILCLKTYLDNQVSQVERAVSRLIDGGAFGQLRGERILRRLEEIKGILDDIELELDSMWDSLEQVESFLESALDKVQRGGYPRAIEDLNEALSALGIALKSRGAVLGIMGRKMLNILQIKQDLFAAERACRRSELHERSFIATELSTIPLSVTKIGFSPNPMGREAQAALRVEGTGIEGLRLQVFDLSGRVVFDRETSNGLTSLVFDGLDQRTKAPLANGVYLYVVTVKGWNGELVRAPVQKLVILR